MSIEDAEKITKLLEKRPKKALKIFVIFGILMIVGALIVGFFSEIGKQLWTGLLSPPPKVGQQPAERRDKGQGLSTSPKLMQQQTEKTKQPDISPKINQHTEGKESPTIVQETKGDQSPAVSVGPGGTSTIIYGAPKKEGGKE